MNTGIIAAIALFVVVVVFWLVMTYRAFNMLNHSAEEGFIAIDYYFMRRRNLVDDLTKLLKNQMPEDAELIEEVRGANRKAKEAVSSLEKLKTEGTLAELLDQLFETVENYQDIKDSKRYTSLREKIEDANENILKAGKMYNSIVRMLNSRLHAFPTSLAAKLFGFKEHPML